MVNIIHADILDALRAMEAESVHLIASSPPYLALRRYPGVGPTTWADGSSCILGLESNLHHYIDHMLEVCEELRRVLHPSGNFMLNVGDSYQHGGPQPSTGIHKRNEVPLPNDYKRTKTFKSKKQLGMIPARLAIALQDREWILREHIVWAKGVSFLKCFSGSVMPESIRDRCTSAWEPIFHFAKQDKYYWDIEGGKEPYSDTTLTQAAKTYDKASRKDYEAAGVQDPSDVKRRILAGVSQGGGRNLRNVWVIAKEPQKENHFASWPTKLVEPMITLGSSAQGVCPSCLYPWERVTHKEAIPAHIQARFEASRVATTADTGRTDGYTARKPNYRRRILGEGWRPTCVCEAGDPIPSVVLDPFVGSGRTGVVAVRLGRDFIGVDASEESCAIARRVIGGDSDIVHPVDLSSLESHASEAD